MTDICRPVPSEKVKPQPVVSVAMLGARMHFAVPSILAGAGLLHTLYTDTYLGNKSWLQHFVGLVPQNLRPKAVKRLSGRSVEGIPADRVVSFDLLGVSYFINRRCRSAWALPELFTDFNTRFGKLVIQAGLNETKMIWGFNGAALEIFRHARAHGITCVLEQSMAPRKLELRLINEEIGRWPNWQDHRSKRTDELVKRETAEWQLAHRIICGSDFVADGLRQEGVARDRITVVPYGIDVSRYPDKPRKPTGELHVLFVGEIGLRKGVPYLLEALRSLDRFGDIKAKLVGPIALSRRKLRKYSRWCEFTGAVPRSELLGLYHWADVFVLPSVCEGSATVTYEAMACGLPIITTRNSGSLVRDGVDGFIIPVGDTEALASRIALLHDDLQLRTRMSSAACAQMAEVSLEAYGARLLTALTLSPGH